MLNTKVIHSKVLNLVFNTLVLVLCCAGANSVLAQQGDMVADGVASQRQTAIVESTADAYVANKKVKPKLGLITFYRPQQGNKSGVASLEVNGHYHGALQLGAYIELCLPAGSISVATRMTQVGSDIKAAHDATTTFTLQEEQNAYLRFVDLGDGRASLSLVQTDIAQAELKGTRRQVHVRSRVPGATECVDSNSKLAQREESLVLVADGIFAFGQSEVNVANPKARQSMDELISHIKKTYGNEKNIVIRVVAHTDPIGNPEANKRLSVARANAIRTYMIKGGLIAEQISSEGKGSEQPLVTTCGTEPTPKNIICNKSNRRMVVTIETVGR